MEIDELIKKGNATVMLDWIKKHSDKEYAELVERAEEETRKTLHIGD